MVAVVQQAERIVNAAAELVTDPLQGLNPAPSKIR